MRRFSFIEPTPPPGASPWLQEIIPSYPKPNSFPSFPAPGSTVKLWLQDGRVVAKAWWEASINRFYGFGSMGYSVGPSDVRRWEYTDAVTPGPGTSPSTTSATASRPASRSTIRARRGSTSCSSALAEILGVPCNPKDDTYLLALEHERARRKIWLAQSVVNGALFPQPERLSDPGNP